MHGGILIRTSTIALFTIAPIAAIIIVVVLVKSQGSLPKIKELLFPSKEDMTEEEMEKKTASLKKTIIAAAVIVVILILIILLLK